MAAHIKTAPPWASWSLVRSMQEESAAASSSVAGPSRIQLGDVEYKESAGAPSQVATLLSHDGDGHDAVWQDFSEERSRTAGQQPGMSGLGSANLPIDAEEMDRLLAPSQSLSTVKLEKEDGFGKETTTQGKSKHAGKSDAQTWRFDPLSEAESRALERALRISKYMPMGGDAEDALDAGDVIEKDSARGGKIRYHKETGRRVYTSIRGTTMIANREAQENLRQLCSLMLPQRNFDWILAQLSYPDTDMIRVPRELLVKAGQKAKISEAIKHVNESTLPLENAAIVMYVLARASGAQVSHDAGIVDPYAATARYRGRPTREARERMSAQSNAIVSIFRELFPSHFAHEQRARSASPIVREAYARLQNVKAVGDVEVKVKANKVRGRCLVLDDESDEESDSEQHLYNGKDRGPSVENNSDEGSEDDAGDVDAMVEDVVESVERPSTGQAEHKDDREKGVLQPYKSNVSGGIMGWLRAPKKDMSKTKPAAQTTKADDEQAEMVASKSVAKTKATQRKRKRESSDATLGKGAATLRKSAKQAVEKASPAPRAKAETTTDANHPVPDPSPCVPSQDPRSSPIRRSLRGDGTASDFKMPLPSFWQKAKK